MSSINTISSGGNRNYMSGLASGMDTESIVQSLLSGTQSKIDKQTGLKQQLTWKQDIYRSLITKINTFGDKYFSYYGSGNTNLLSNSFYNTMTGTSSSSAVKINSISSSAPGSLTINSITQIATACTVKSRKEVTGAPVGTKADLSAFKEGEKYSFSVSLDGVKRTITFTGGSTAEGTLSNINEELYRNFGTAVGMEQDTNSGGIKLVQLVYDSQTPKVTSGSTSVDASRRVIFEPVVGEETVLKNLGFEGGFSNKLDYGTSIKHMNFATSLQGDRYEFEINGVTIKGLTGDSTLSDVLSAINNSDAGVKISYSSASDRFVMEATSTGDISKISMSQTYGNLLTSMFGVEATGVQSSLIQKPVEGGETDGMAGIREALNSGKDQEFVFQVDGKDVTIKLEGKTGGSKYETDQSVIDELNSRLSRAFGVGAITVSMEAGTVDTKQVFKIQSAEHEVGFSTTNLTDGIAGALGFTEGNNFYSQDTTLGETGLSGSILIKNSDDSIVVTLSESMTLKEVDKTLKDAKIGSCQGGRLEISGTSNGLKIEGGDGDGTASVEKLFGKKEIHFKSPIDTQKAVTTPGQNAEFTVNGVAMKRNTNTFEIDGITLEITGKSDSPIHLTTSRDTDKIVDSLKSFVDDYNVLIEEMNKYVAEESSYKKYPPLTDAQKKEMSDKEIELWEENSKKGLLRNDSNVSKFLSDMRMVLYNSVESAGLALYDIGIETSNNWRDNGKLILDEEKLKSAIATNPNGIQKMFTDKEHGIAVQLQKVIKDTANVSSGSPGSMVKYAGTKDVLLTNNTLYEEMKHITETLSNLNTKYELEKARYWKQFTAMEQAISSMNSQSSWLAQQFSIQ